MVSIKLLDDFNTGRAVRTWSCDDGASASATEGNKAPPPRVAAMKGAATR